MHELFILQTGQIVVSNTRPVQLMIIGIGNDLCDIRRIEKTLDRFGERFIQRVFTDIEQKDLKKKKFANNQ